MSSKAETRLERLLWNVGYHVLFSRVTTHWRWPERGDSKSEWEEIRFSGWAGGELAGLWGAAWKPARGTIVLAHPTSKKAKGYFLDFGHGRFLRNAGYNVLIFDFNGFGESPHRTFQYPHDILAAGREAHRRAPGLPVGLFGVCFGAVYGVCAMTYPNHGFTAAVLEAPYATVDGILASMQRRSGRYLLYTVRRLMMRALMPIRPELRALSQVPHIRELEAALFISGEMDDYVDPSVVADFAAACRASDAPAAAHCELWEVPGAEHLKTPLPDPPAYAQRVLNFFDTAFARASTNTMREDMPCKPRQAEPAV